MAGRENVGDYKFRFEEFDNPRPGGSGKLQRTVEVSGRLAAKRTNVSRDSTIEPLMGALSSFAFRVTGLDRGHLIALGLGGPDCPENLVPMYAQFNQRGGWKALEKQLADDGATEVKIKIHYNDNIPFLPNYFVVCWTIKDKNGNEKPKSRIVHMQAHAPKPYVAPANYSAFKDIIEPHLPQSKDQYEPYAFLEKLRDKLDLKPPEDNKGFSEAERVAIKVANALYDEQAGNKGFLMSDDSRDPHQTLNEMGNDDQPQVDHIWPKSANGSNSFRNAKLLSKKRNNSKRAKLAEESMDAAKAAASALKSTRERNKTHRYSPYPKR